jgi:PST family polysaccharide transporter
MPSVPGGGQALRRLAVRGAGMTVFSGGVGVTIQVVAAVVLGRLLTPRDFGLVTMVTTFSLLLLNATANGFTDAVVQRKEINHRLASNLFWISLVIGVVLAAGFIAAGPLIARFFGEAPIARIAAGISISVFLTNASVLHLALLKRAMRFSTVAANDIVARAVGVLVSIIFGFLGWGYWALVIGTCSLALSTTVGAWILCRWIPGRPRRISGTGSMLLFAGHISGRFSVNYFARNSDNLLVGWRFGAHALGYYKKAYDLFALSASQLVSATSTVAVSALSRVRDNREQYLRYLLGAIGIMAFLGMGLAGDLTLVGRDLIRILLGPGWEPAGRIFTYFAPGIGIMMVYGTHGWIHVSIGRADRWFAWGIIECSLTFLLFLAGLPWGPQGIAVAWCASFWILAAPALWYAGKPIHLAMSQVFNVVWQYVAASLFAGVATHFAFLQALRLAALPGVAGAALRLISMSSLFVILYLAAIVVLHRSFSPLLKIARIFRELITGVSRARATQKPADPVVT